MQKETALKRLREIKEEYEHLLNHLKNSTNKDERELLLPLMVERYNSIVFAIQNLEK